MIVGLLLGGGVGVGGFLVLRALVWPRPPLTVALADLDRSRPSVAERQRARRAEPGGVRLGRRVAEFLRLAGLHVDAVAPDLRVVGRPVERHAFEKVGALVVGLAMPVLYALLASAGGVRVPPGFVAVVSLVAGVGGFFLPDAVLRHAARARRHAFRHALSSYLDLVNVVLAGGAGIETALRAAADAGDGWSFVELRAALDRAQFTRRSPWDVFDDLGTDLGIVELGELSASARLAGEQGARIKSSLVAKAASLRGHELARIEAAAQSASERMAIPTVLLFTAFIVFVGYPALAAIVGSSGL